MFRSYMCSWNRSPISEWGTVSIGYTCTLRAPAHRHRKNHSQWSYYQFFCFAHSFEIPTPLFCSKASSHFFDIWKSQLSCSQRLGHELPNIFQFGAWPKRNGQPSSNGFLSGTDSKELGVEFLLNLTNIWPSIRAVLESKMTHFLSWDLRGKRSTELLLIII